MKSRFIKAQDESKKKLVTKNQRLRIESYSTIKIILQSLIDFKSMILLNVAYVSNFMTNLMSQSVLKKKKLCFDN
jgi:hypothetical protein